MQLKKFLTTTLVLIASRVFDIYTTYLFIPDLKGETNPLVSAFHLGWTGTLIVQAVVLVLLIYCLYYYSFKQIEVPDFGETTSLQDFISLFHFGKSGELKKLFYTFPKNKESLLYSTGGIVPQGLVVFSLLVGTSTTFLIVNPVYRNIYHAYDIPVLLYTFSALIMYAFAVKFYKAEMKSRMREASV
ncbi:MAG: hypothetical protein GC181_11470 [Bacteroidetes bacterium]|nr:hypothetical protein [Bacteroidota bacterium]